jgi:AcrR family transcriptional regulator
MSAEFSATKARILEAAFQRLARKGYAATSLREIAKDAGVNLALINYHFKSKVEVAIAVFEEANRRLLERQRRLYETQGCYADKWAQARRFYDDDLASGFVRVLMELYAASMSSEKLREAFRPRTEAWVDLMNGAVHKALVEYGIELDFPPDVVGCWISSFWMGMELAMSAGVGDPKLHQQSLQVVEKLLRRLDARKAEALTAAPRPAHRTRAS